MLQSMVFQRVGHNLVTEEEEKTVRSQGSHQALSGYVTAVSTCCD